MTRSSEVPGFYRRSIAERRAFVQEWGGLTDEEARAFEFPPGVDPGTLDRMIENVIGVMPLPLGIATNFQVNGKDYLIPMAIEEPSVVAAASNAAKVVRASGGFFAQSTAPVMIGQVQILDVPDPVAARLRILHRKEELLAAANAKDPVLVKFGGGAKDLEVRILASPRGTMMVVHLLVDARDAGGMNAVNTMCEALAPEFARLAGGRVVLRIISNLAVHRLARAHATFPAELLKTETATGPEVVDAILDAYALAVADPFRCATHNKGIMNGISSVVIATGNDFRAIESGAHTYAAWRAGESSAATVVLPLTTYEKDKDGNLVGTIELPAPVGLIGGATAVHPTAKANVKVLGVRSARELGEVLAAVGLAQNFSALRALATEGIQRGHMELHARNLAASAGARPEEVDRVVARLVADHQIRFDRAKEILDELRRAGAGMKVGVLALQGDVPEHLRVLRALVRDPLPVRTPSELAEVRALFLPGGESTAIARLLDEAGLWAPLADRLQDGLPVLATCAGLILLARELAPGAAGQDPPTFRALDVTVRRNDYGAQRESCEAPVTVEGLGRPPFPGVFIRSPRILAVGPQATPIAWRGEEVVGVRAGAIWGLAFHPELSGDLRVHRRFLAAVGGRA